MATLEKIRSKAGLLVIVIGLALFAFIIGDFLRSGSTFFRQSKEKIVIVDGESVSIKDYQAKVEEITEVYKMQSGNGTSIPEEVVSQLRESVFDGFVRQIIMGEESKEVGFTVGKKELSDLLMGDNISPMIQQMPQFRNKQTNAFDKNMLLQFLQTIEATDLSTYPEETKQQIMQAKKYWLFWEQNIKQQKLEEKFGNLLAKAVVANSLDAKAAFEDNKVSVDFDYVQQVYGSVADDQVTVSESEIKALYEKRKMQYKQQESQLISYIAVDIVPSEEDYKEVGKIMDGVKSEFASAADVSDVVNDNSDIPFVNAYVSLAGLDPESKRFVETASIGDVEGPALTGNTYHMRKFIDKTVSPDSIKFSQIMLPSMEEAQQKHLADSLVLAMKEKGFETVAMEMTQGQSNGDMGWTTEYALLRNSDEKFKDNVLSAPLKDIMVIKSTYGTHIVQVVEKTAPVTKYKVADIVMAVSPSTNTYNKLYNDLNKYVSANNTLDKFKSAATESGYICQSGFPVTKNDPQISAIANSRPVVRWAYEHVKGDISDIFECQEKFVVAMVEGSLQNGYRSLESVSELLKRELINDKKAEKIIADLKAKNLSSIEQYAETMNSTVQSVKFVSFATPSITGIGVEPVLNENAPVSEIGKLSAPLKGNGGVYVFKVTDKHVSDIPYNQATQQQTLNAASYRLVYQAMPVLKDKAKIEDNRIRFY